MKKIKIKCMDQIVLREGQQRAFDKIVDFIRNDQAKVFILKGYAGTGKTTMMKVLIEELKRRNLLYLLLASTGRASKILSNATGKKTSTIHGAIYHFQDLNQDMEEVVKKRNETEIDSTGQIFITFGLDTVLRLDDEVCYYIVDESSMVSDKVDKMATQALFGSGRLLKDLLEYDPNGKFIFIGDACQLPPVQQKISPALSIEYFKNVFGIEAEEVELTDIVRQREGNDLILASQRLRKLYHNPPEIKWAKFPFKGYKNIELLSSQAELIGRYIEDVKSKGFNYSSILCYSNKQCDMLTRLLRPMLGIYSQQLAAGDLLLVTQNNNLSGLMNGDVVTVQQVVVKEQRAGLTFLKVSVKELFTGKEYSQLMIADVLYGNQTNLTQSQQKELFIDFFIRMKHQGLRQKDDAFKSMMIKDPYLNALRAVFGYALTCHKAQGGEWEHIYLDVPRNFPLVEKPYVYQWMYTAMTRAKYKMFTINDFWVE